MQEDLATNLKDTKTNFSKRLPIFKASLVLFIVDQYSADSTAELPIGGDKNKPVSSNLVKYPVVFATGLFIIAFGLLTILVKSAPYLSFDLYITREIQMISSLPFKNLMLFITAIGYPFWGSTILIVTGLFLSFIKQYKEALVLFISSLGATLIGQLLQSLIERPRPDPLLIIRLDPLIRNFSYPSGHVLFFIGFYGFLLFLTYTKLKSSALKTILMFFLGSMIILVGLSRIYLGAHWFSDVLGSYLIGTVWLYLMVRLYHKLVKTK